MLKKELWKTTKIGPSRSLVSAMLYEPQHFRWREWEVIKPINILVIDFNILAWVIMLCYICLFACNFRLCIHSGVVGQQLVCTRAQKTAALLLN